MEPNLYTRTINHLAGDHQEPHQERVHVNIPTGRCSDTKTNPNSTPNPKPKLSIKGAQSNTELPRGWPVDGPGWRAVGLFNPTVYGLI